MQKMLKKLTTRSMEFSLPLNLGLKLPPQLPKGKVESNLIIFKDRMKKQAVSREIDTDI